MMSPRELFAHELINDLLGRRLKPHKVAEQLRAYDEKNGVTPLPTVDKYENEATKIRREWLGVYLDGPEGLGMHFEHVASYSIDMNETANDGLTIGVAQVPVKYVGDILVNGEHANSIKGYPVFMATLEGYLAAGTSRGIETFNEAGGITTVVKRDGMTRDVLVGLQNINEAKRLYNWLESVAGQEFLEREFNSRTTHGRFVEARPYMDGKHVHIRYRATTGAAMGMNIVTDVGRSVTEALMEEVTRNDLVEEIEIITPSGNMCCDKKAAFINMLEGRGMSVEAEAYLPIELVHSRFFKKAKKYDTPLKAAKRLVRVNRQKNERGTRLAGAFSANTHAANPLAGFYIAYGQDVAQIVEGSMAIIELDMTDDDKFVYVHGSFPALELATYMGETKYGTQRELLKATGVWGENDETGETRLRFGEIIAAATTAADVNLTAVQAALELGRTRPKKD